MKTWWSRIEIPTHQRLRSLIVAGVGYLASVTLSHAEPIRIAVDNWPPFQYETESGFVGIDIELAKEIAERMAAELQVLKKPWGRSLKSMETGQVDILTGLAYREERAKYIAYTDTPYYACSTVFYTAKGEGNDIKTYEDLKRFSIGYVLHSAYFEPFDSDDAITKVGVATEDNLMDMLVNKRIKTIVGTDCQVDYYLQTHNLHQMIEKAEFRPGNTVNLFLGVSKKSPWAAQLDEFNAVVKELVDEGYVLEASKSYYGTLGVN